MEDGMRLFLFFFLSAFSLRVVIYNTEGNVCDLSSVVLSRKLKYTLMVDVLRF